MKVFASEHNVCIYSPTAWCQKKSAAEGRRLGVLFGILKPVFLLGVFLPLHESGVGGDFKTPNLGFCVGSKGTRDDPSGLTSRLRSDFLNSAP